MDVALLVKCLSSEHKGLCFDLLKPYRETGVMILG